VVEIIVKKGGRCRYTTIQNWSNNVYNLVTKRAVAYRSRPWSGSTDWVQADHEVPGDLHDGAGAHVNAVDRVRGQGQHQDAGAKAVHCAPNTSSKIVSKSISKDGGRAGYRGL